MLHNPLVSIVVPTYNTQDTLIDALVSLQEQTYKNLEIICVNDGSTDSSLKIMEAFASEDDRFHIIDKPNTGYGASCNAGIQAAKGAWIGILEPDDWIDLDMIESMIAFRNSLDCPVDIIKTPYWRIADEGEPGTANVRKLHCSYKGAVKPKTQPFGLADAPELFAHHPSIWSALYRRAYLIENHIVFPEYPGSGWADNRFLADTLLRTNGIIYLDKPFYNYRATDRVSENEFAGTNALLLIERWQEMNEVIKDAHVHDEAVLMAHNRRGFTYLGQIERGGGCTDEHVQQQIEQMISQMDLRLVLIDPAVSPSNKKRAARIYGVENHKPAKLPYLAHLAKKGLRGVKNNGVSATLHDALS